MQTAKMILPSTEWVDQKNKISARHHVQPTNTHLHMHDYFELELILDGEGTQNLNGKSYEIKRGTVYFLSPLDFHSILPRTPLKLINVSFDHSFMSPNLLNMLINRRMNLIFDLSEEEMRQTEFFSRLILSELDTNDDFTANNVKGLLENLLTFFLRQSHHKRASDTEEDAQTIYPCIRYLFSHFQQTPSREEMARMCGYSENYFSKQFHAVTGKTYIDFLTTLKLNYAKLLLASTTDSVIAVASACGFTSLSNFNRVFKNEIGASPTQYRAQNATLRSYKP